MGESLREPEDIRRNLGRIEIRHGLDQAIQGLRRANDALMRDDMRTAPLLKDQVIEPLRNVELELSKRLQMKLGKNNLRLSDEGEAPAAYRRVGRVLQTAVLWPIVVSLQSQGGWTDKTHTVWERGGYFILFFLFFFIF